jgi:integrase
VIDTFLSSHPYAASTKRTYLDILTRFTAEVPNPAAITAAQLLAWIDKPTWGKSRQCLALACVQKFLKWNFGQAHPASLAKLKRIVGTPQRALDPDTALKLLASFDTYTAKGARDLAICSLALDTGLRCSELCRLQQAHTDTNKCVLQVIVKGGQWQAAVFSEETAAHIERWKLFRQDLKPQGFLFVSTRIVGAGLTPEGLNQIMRQWGLAIGIKLSPHDLRRSFAVLATVNGAPERVLMEGGRWSSSQMISRYTRTLKLEAMRQYLPMSKLK